LIDFFICCTVNKIIYLYFIAIEIKPIDIVDIKNPTKNKNLKVVLFPQYRPTSHSKLPKIGLKIYNTRNIHQLHFFHPPPLFIGVFGLLFLN